MHRPHPPNGLQFDLSDAQEKISSESLVDRIGRAKARWLRRVIYSTPASPTQKCLAYAIADHLNCVTLDSWPSQPTLANLLGFESLKTIQRAARGLVRLQVLTLKVSGKGSIRYAPVFLPGDEDKIELALRHSRSVAADNSGRESFLIIQSNLSNSTEGAAKQGHMGPSVHCYDRRRRGSIEIKLAEMLGPNGIDVLSRLNTIDDAIIERLCGAYSAGLLGARELHAARLAAKQAR